MSELVIIKHDEQLLVDSRDVAEMTGIRHGHLLEKIDGYVQILSNSTEPKFRLSDFFIEATYQDSTGRTLKCYLITKKGCDMVANKMTGEKGVLFTAAYVTKFEEMEAQIMQPKLPHTYKDALLELIGEIEKNEVLQLENAELRQKTKYVDQILKSKGTMTITQIAKDYGMSGPTLNKILHEEKVQYKQNKQWLLYQKYQDKGFTKSETIDITRSNGDPDVTLNTRWTQKGRLFIHELLSKRDIAPYMDR